MPKKYSHLCDVGFVFEDENSDIFRSNPLTIIAAMERRVNLLKSMAERGCEEFFDAIGESDTYEVKD